MKNNRWVATLLLVVGMMLLLSACATTQQQYTEDYAKAKQNFAAGKYPVAFKQVQAPAKGGNADAQYALGYMYYYGKGTFINPTLAKYWFEQAASQGQPAAKRALVMIRRKKS